MMSLRLIIMICSSFLGAFSLKAQLSDHLYVENEYSSLMIDLGIIECQSFITKFENGNETEKYLREIEKYNEHGLLISSIYLNLNSDTNYYMAISYNSSNRLSEIDWFWYNEGEIDEIIKIVYYYNSLGQVIKECEFAKHDAKYIQDTCLHFHYIDGKLDIITNVNNDTLIYYQYTGNRAYRFDNNHKIVSYYRNGLQEYLIEGTSKFSYTRDINSNIIFVVNFNTKLNTFNKTHIEYKDGIPIKSTQYDEFGNTMSIIEYVYKKNK